MLTKCWKSQCWNCLCGKRRGSFCQSLLSWVHAFKRRCFLTWPWWLRGDSHPDIFGLDSYHSIWVERESILMLTLKSMYSLNGLWIYYKHISTYLSAGYTNDLSAGVFHICLSPALASLLGSVLPLKQVARYLIFHSANIYCSHIYARHGARILGDKDTASVAKCSSCPQRKGLLNQRRQCSRGH